MIRLLAVLLALALCAAPAWTQSMSIYGDKTQIYDGAGSHDDYASYNPPAAFITWVNARNWDLFHQTDQTAPNYAPANSDVLAHNWSRLYPFVLNQHAPYDPTRVPDVVLRFDFRFDRDWSAPWTDALIIWDEDKPPFVFPTFGFGERVWAVLDCPNGPDCQQQPWLRVEVDLRTGLSTLSEIDENGSVVRAYGSLGGPWGTGTYDVGSAFDGLVLGSDGNLFGYVQDDMEAFSYAELCLGSCSGDYDLSWFTVDGGGSMQITGGAYELSGTIGQPDATPVAALTGGVYAATGGFWPVAAPSGCRGDMNCDGRIDFADIDPFVAVLSGGVCCDPSGYNCDVNGDGSVDFGDIDPFVALLSSGATCP